MNSWSVSILISLIRRLFWVSLPITSDWSFHHLISVSLDCKCRYLPCGVKNVFSPVERSMQVRGSLDFESNR